MKRKSYAKKENDNKDEDRGDSDDDDAPVVQADALLTYRPEKR